MGYLTSNLLEQCLSRLIKLKVDKRARVFTGNPKSSANECIKWPRVGWGGDGEKEKFPGLFDKRIPWTVVLKPIGEVLM